MRRSWTVALALLLAPLSCKEEARERPATPAPRVHNPTHGYGGGGGSGVESTAEELESHTLGPAMGAGPLVELTVAHLTAYTKGLGDDGDLVARIATDFGAIDCRLLEDKAPKTVANFVGLARGLRRFTDVKTSEPTTRPFYDGVQCHRLIPNFMIQCGDPTATGGGGPGYRFADEIDPTVRHDRPGTLSMANGGPSTNGSQFFLTERPTPHLDGKHTVFGYCEPLDVIKTIARVPKDPDDPMLSTPMKPVFMKKVTIVRR